MKWRFILLLLVTCATWKIFAQDGATYPTTTKKAASLTNAPIVEISSNIFRIGLVTLDKERRSISFPAAINMNSNLIEFVCDGGDTKLHESLFRTDASPLHIHLAALLLRKPGSGSTNNIPVTITSTFGKEKEVPIERMILKGDPKTGKQIEMPRGNWVYTGWNQYHNRMPSDISGVVIALLGDSTALINSKDADHENDDIWKVNPETTPPVGTPVLITLHLQSALVNPK